MLKAKLVTPGQLLGPPWKVWGITAQTSYWEGWWHQNCGYTSPILFLGVRTRKSVKSGTFQWENFSGQAVMESLFTRDSKNLNERGVQKLWPCFGHWKLGECDQTRSVSKIMRCKKVYLPKSSKLSHTTQITSFLSLWEEVSCVGKLNFEDFANMLFFK